MQAARNIAIILLLALGVAFVPGGGNAAQTILTALSMGFLAALGFFAYRFFRENRLTLSTIDDNRRVVLYGAVGVIALMIVWADEAFAQGGVRILAWIALLGLSIFAIVKVWIDAASY